MGPIQSFDDVLAFLRRRAWPILLVLCLGVLASVVYALRQPHVYEATAVIQLEAPKIADTLAPSTVAEPAARRLQTIEQRMMARGELLALIDEFGLFADLPALTPTEKVVQLRNLTRIRGIEAASETAALDGALSGVRITVRLGTRELAEEVANELAARLIALSKQERIDRTHTTLDFFENRESKLAAEIAVLEDRIVAVRNEHELTVSGGVQFRRVEINTLQEALIGIDREILTRQSMLRKLEQGRRTAVDERRIGDLRDELETFQTEKDMLTAQREALAQTIAGLPEVEQQLAVLQGRLDQLDEQYAIATRNRADAETAHLMELTDRAETLRVIEPAVKPDYPVAPSRRMIAAKGGLASLMLALGIGLLLDLRRPVIRNAAQMERELGLRPVVAIGHFASPHEIARGRALGRAAMLAGGLILALGAALLVIAP